MIKEKFLWKLWGLYDKFSKINFSRMAKPILMGKNMLCDLN